MLLPLFLPRKPRAGADDFAHAAMKLDDDVKPLPDIADVAFRHIFMMLAAPRGWRWR